MGVGNHPLWSGDFDDASKGAISNTSASVTALIFFVLLAAFHLVARSQKTRRFSWVNVDDRATLRSLGLFFFIQVFFGVFIQVLYPYVLIYMIYAFWGWFVDELMTPYSRRTLVIASKWKNFSRYAWIARALCCLGIVVCHLAMLALGAPEVSWAPFVLAILVLSYKSYRCWRSNRGRFGDFDKAWYSQYPDDGDKPKYKRPDPATPNESLYIKGFNDVPLAVDIYHPVNREGEREGNGHVFLHFTRYSRNVYINFPWNYIYKSERINPRTGRVILELIPHGYTVVTVDVRGTGASGGTRLHDMAPDEVEDFAIVTEWVHSQDWCTGSIATGGVSYDALTALMAAARSPKLIRAVYFVHGPVDAYEDVIKPGGLACTGFMEDYSEFGHSIAMSEQIRGIRTKQFAVRFLLTKVLGGVVPVPGHEEECKKYLAEHAANWHMSGFIKSQRARYQRARNGDQFVAFGVQPKSLFSLRDGGVKVRSVCGYYDTASVRSVLRIQTVLGRLSSAIIGPWNHGARRQCSPFSPHNAPAQVARFSYYHDLRMFLEQTLADKPPAPSKDEHALSHSVQYYMTGAERWCHGDFDTFNFNSELEPVETDHKEDRRTGRRRSSTLRAPLRRIVFAMDLARNTLVLEGEENYPAEPDEDLEQTVVYDLPLSSTSGVISRWNILRMESVLYRNREEETVGLPKFTSQPLKYGMIIKGCVNVELVFEALDSADAAIFAYLEDVDPQGNVRYITEGQVLASCREIDPLSTEPPNFPDEEEMQQYEAARDRQKSLYFLSKRKQTEINAKRRQVLAAIKEQEDADVDVVETKVTEMEVVVEKAKESPNHTEESETNGATDEEEETDTKKAKEKEMKEAAEADALDDWSDPWQLARTLDIPYRNYHHLTRRPLKGVETIRLSLEPVGHLFQPGHRIRLTLAARDADNFEIPDELSRKWKIYGNPSAFSGELLRSVITMPVPADLSSPRAAASSTIIQVVLR